MSLIQMLQPESGKLLECAVMDCGDHAALRLHIALDDLGESQHSFADDEGGDVEDVVTAVITFTAAELDELSAVVETLRMQLHQHAQQGETESKTDRIVSLVADRMVGHLQKNPHLLGDLTGRAGADAAFAKFIAEPTVARFQDALDRGFEPVPGEVINFGGGIDGVVIPADGTDEEKAAAIRVIPDERARIDFAKQIGIDPALVTGPDDEEDEEDLPAAAKADLTA